MDIIRDCKVEYLYMTSKRAGWMLDGEDLLFNIMIFPNVQKSSRKDTI